MRCLWPVNPTPRQSFKPSCDDVWVEAHYTGWGCQRRRASPCPLPSDPTYSLLTGVQGLPRHSCLSLNGMEKTVSLTFKQTAHSCNPCRKFLLLRQLHSTDNEPTHPLGHWAARGTASTLPCDPSYDSAQCSWPCGARGWAVPAQLPEHLWERRVYTGVLTSEASRGDDKALS